ncbi:uncharacterized protein LOC123566724 [Mercenaria mercenaria]|uniref:uncharacterized protein LOC123566724 n=1 Tax=Mercenaria mercenaria TaxID=6596 RepID=UPI00234F55AA|nr:uncharacterized protein LOC123566724 [Mercenaria mercenaria]XP_045216979.2 uncharacterized protein LOC123566724 [Mercenaria mercenaria]
MGVRGLRSFIREKRDKFLIDFKLQNTKLIIDGSNLLYFLHLHYEDENVYGGNYDHFSKRCKDFFKTLLKCNITPVVVFDGADDPDNMKLDTILKRLDEHFKKVNKWQKTEELLPILSKITLCQILEELSIPHMACVYEADKEIAVLANKYECPVLSDDSDFYVYSLNMGSISMACMVESERRDLAGRFYLPVKLYKRKLVLKEVFHMENDEYMFPVFATLVGNDIFDPSNITLSNPKNPRDKLSCATRNLRKLLEWICTVGFESGEIALDHISRQMSQEERKQFQTSVHSYLAIAEFSIFDLEAFLKNSQIGNIEHPRDEADSPSECVSENQNDSSGGTRQCMTANQREPLDIGSVAPSVAAIKLESSDDDSAIACETVDQHECLDNNDAISNVVNRLESSHNTCAIACETIYQRELLDIDSTTPSVTANKPETSKATNVIAHETADQGNPLEDNRDKRHQTVKQQEPLEDNIGNTHLTTNQLEPLFDKITSARTPANPCEHVCDNVSSTYLIANHRKSVHENNMGLFPHEPSEVKDTGTFDTNVRVHAAEETSEVQRIELKDRNGNQLPSWFVNSVIKCKMDCSFILNVAENHRLIFKAQAEMHELPSSFNCSEGIRRVIYRLVLDPEKQFKHKKQRSVIREYHRRSTERSHVKPIERLQCIPELPCLETIPLLSDSERKNIVYATLGAMPALLDKEVDETSQILIIMLSLWKANSRASKCHLNSLIIGIFALHMFNPTGYVSCPDILDAIEATSRHSIDDFKKRMEKHFCKHDYLARHGINKVFIHKVSQFQAVFLHTYHLNQLLLRSVRMPSPGVVLNSTFDYSMCHLLENNVQPKNILCGEESSLYCLFKKWKNSIEDRCKGFAR